MIYLDNNATTQVRAEVREAMLPHLGEAYGNPSGGYRFAKQARGAVEIARRQVAALIDAAPEEIIFTSCGTESNNTALRSALESHPERRHIVTTTAEHSAIENHCVLLERGGYEVTRLPVSSEGRLDPGALEKAIRPGETAIVSIIWANNETGVLSPVAELAAICAGAGVLFHTDAVQAVGKIPVSVKESGVNLLSISGHKLHAPKGVGALFADRRVRFKPMLIGGGQENGRRSGTENVPGIAGLGVAAELVREELAGGRPEKLRSLRDRFEKGILEAIPEAEVNGHQEERLPNTTNIFFAGVDAEGLLVLLDEKDVCCSPGSACSTGKIEPSRVILAMGFSRERARSSVRFSFSLFNTEEEADAAVGFVAAAALKIRSIRPVKGGPVAIHGTS